MLKYLNQLAITVKCRSSHIKVFEIVQNIERATFVTSISTYSRRSSIQRRVDKRLQRLLKKNKYKFSFAAVSHTQLGSLVNQPSSTKKGGKVMGPEGSIKLKTYNTILHEHVDDIISSNQISQELQDLQVSIIGVRLTGDMSTCRIYWQASGDHKDNQRIQNVLDSYARKIRYRLINHRVLGKIPQIVFLQERTAAMKAEVERLLEKADIPVGDPDDGPTEAEGEQEGGLTNEFEPVLGLNQSQIQTQIKLSESSQDVSNRPEPVLGLNQSQIQTQIKLLKKLQAQKQQNLDFIGNTTEGSIDKFKSSIKRRKKARDKGLYDAGNYWEERLQNADERNNDDFDADGSEENNNDDK